MNIAVWYNLPSGGGKRALYNHVQGLITLGHHVEVWCPTTANRTFLPLSNLALEHVVPIDWDMTPAPNQFVRLLRARWNVPRKIKAMHAHCRRCAEEIHAGKFDILFANSCQLFYAPTIGRHVQLPKLLYLQEPARMLYEAMPRLPWAALERAPSTGRFKHAVHVAGDAFYVNLLRLQVREELRNAGAYDALLVNSLFSRESVMRAYHQDASVCYLGIDMQHFQNVNLTRENFIVGIGAFLPNKRIEFVIEALSHIGNNRPDLVWIGNGGSKSYLNELVQRAKERNVTFQPLQDVKDEDLHGILNRAAVMAYAPRLEPFGFVSIEANACGVPVVGVAEGGVRETVIDGFNGFLVDPEPAAMARAIEKLIAEPELARQMGKNGRNRAAELFSLEAANERLVKHLNSVFQQKSRQ